MPKANEVTFPDLDAAKKAAAKANEGNPKHKRQVFAATREGKTVYIVTTNTHRARAIASFNWGILVKNAEPKTWSRRPLAEQVADMTEEQKDELRRALGLPVKAKKK